MKKLFTYLILSIITLTGFTRSNECHETQMTNPLYVNVMDFGARGDGMADDTKAVQAAIDKCSADGTKLFFPEGTFMTGTIYLRSNTSVELTAKAVWKGIARMDVYTKQALIYGEDLENVSICGQGMIHGNGDQPAFIVKSGVRDIRPFGILIYRSRDVRIEGVQMQSSAFWMQNYVECDHVRITGIRVFNHANINNDGLDLTDCHDVIISDCEIDSDDDAICPKSSNEKGITDLVVSNCIVATRAHGFKLGTASRGCFRHITVNNLVVRPSKSEIIRHPSQIKGGKTGIELLSSDGAILEDITIQNVVMDGLESPMCIKLGDRWADRKGDSTRTRKETPGVIRNILISHVIARNSGPIPSSITGYPGHIVENITLSDILIEVTGGLPEQDVVVPENSSAYPVNEMFGPKLPAYAFFVRHAKNVKFRDIEIRTTKPDDRRAYVFEDATGVLENVDIINSGGIRRAPVLVDKRDALELRGSSLN